MLYIADALVFEESLLSTMDITTEGLGFMLVFGNLAWVPFVYSLQTRYIYEHTVDLPTWALGLMVLLNCEYIFFVTNVCAIVLLCCKITIISWSHASCGCEIQKFLFS